LEPFTLSILRIDHFHEFLNFGATEAAEIETAQFLDAAEAFTDAFIETPLADYWVEPAPERDGDGNLLPVPPMPEGATPMPAALKHAVFMLAGHLFEHRAAYGPALREVPSGYWDLLAPYRTWSFA
jgi:hypothetical protein